MVNGGNTKKPNIPVVILAGGRSLRFGSEKALASFEGKPLIQFLMEQLARQTTGPVAVNCDPASELRENDYTVISDLIGAGLGPLAGIHASMCWASELGYSHVVTTPVDTPVIPGAFVRELSALEAPVFSRHDGISHFLHGRWPVELKDDLSAFIADGGRAAKQWLAHCGAVECDFGNADGAAPFFNVNTPEDLETLKQLQVSPR